MVKDSGMAVWRCGGVSVKGLGVIGWDIKHVGRPGRGGNRV